MEIKKIFYNKKNQNNEIKLCFIILIFLDNHIINIFNKLDMLSRLPFLKLLMFDYIFEKKFLINIYNFTRVI